MGKIKKQVSKTTLKRKCDKLFSELIRSKGKCEFCPNKETLQCCHIVTRTIVKLRFDEDNALCLCGRCHRHGHNKPLEFAEKVKKIKGEDVCKYLMKATRVLRPISVIWYARKVKQLEKKLSTIST